MSAFLFNFLLSLINFLAINDKNTKKENLIKKIHDHFQDYCTLLQRNKKSFIKKNIRIILSIMSVLFLKKRM